MALSVRRRPRCVKGKSASNNNYYERPLDNARSRVYRCHMTTKQLYLTLEQAAERCATSPHTIYEWIRKGKLRAYRPGKRILIRIEDLERLIRGAVL